MKEGRKLKYMFRFGLFLFDGNLFVGVLFIGGLSLFLFRIGRSLIFENGGLFEFLRVVSCRVFFE